MKSACLLIVLLLTSTTVLSDVAPAPVWQSGPTGRIARVDEPPPLDDPDPLSAETWRKTETFGPLFASGVPEGADRAADVRMLLSKRTLYVAARCLDPTPESIRPADNPDEIWKSDSLELHFTQGPERRYPCLHLQVSPAGQLSLQRYLLPFGSWAQPLTERCDTGPIKVKGGMDRAGWWVVLAIPLDAYGVTGPPLWLNVVRNRSADKSMHAWVDLWGGLTHRLGRLGRVMAAEPPLKPLPRLRLPASLAVGTNTLTLENWSASGGTCRLLVNGLPVPVDAQGKTSLRIDRHQLVDLDVVGVDGTNVARYSAEVRRPLLIAADEPFGNDPAKPIPVHLSLNVAADKPVKVTVEVRQNGKSVGRQDLDLKSGEHALELPHQGTTPGEVEILARAESIAPPGPAVTVPMASGHWCVVGMGREAFDRFRPGIELMADMNVRPTSSFYRAAAADAGAFYRLIQAGDGAIRGVSGQGRYSLSEWNTGMVYLLALLYKADWPENPHRGDKRFLHSAAAGIETGLDPRQWQETLSHLPNRGLQGYLLAYDLIKNDVPRDQAETWRKGLTTLVQATIDTWVDAARHKVTFYSEDVGTGTNHYAYHVMNVYLGGKLLGRPDWVALGTEMMRRLARHEEDGQYPERRDVPAVHYSHLTAHNMALYYLLSGDETVRESVLRSAEFISSVSMPDADVMALVDGRNNHHGPATQGDLVLSLTPRGRALARVRMTRSMRPGAGPGGTWPEFWFCAAVSAAHWPQASRGEESMPQDAEFFLLRGRGLIARRQGFIYGLSAICVPSTDHIFWVDPQNTVELYHEKAGWILSGANSRQQPEAGSFSRVLKDRTVFLPLQGHVQRTETGHAAELTFDTFQAQVLVHVVSKDTVEIKAEVTRKEGDGPVVYSFFPEVGWLRQAGESGKVSQSDDGRTICFRSVTIACSHPVRLEQDFLIADPYSLRRNRRVKPVRAFAELDVGRPLVLKVTVGPSDPDGASGSRRGETPAAN